MNLPFSADEFFGVFARYNEAVWPAQFALNVVAVACVVLAFRKGGRPGRWISVLLAALWLWIAIAYHFAFFSLVNPAAWLFGAVSLAGGLVFLRLGVRKETLRFAPAADWRGASGGILIAYALVGYPLLGSLLGHRYPAAPTFGVPCPTTIFTLGMLLLAERPVPRLAFIVPILWAAVGSTAALALGVVEDYGLLVAGIVALAATLVPQGRHDAER